jgi:surface carbohydrate biosynthesis protein (TIGR04326 family)
MKNNSYSKHFFLLSAYSSPEGRLSLFSKKNEWYYIGTDYQMFLRWKTVLDSVGIYRSLSKVVEEYGLRLRNNFLEYIAEMSEKNNSLAWWMTSLADKDPSASDFYLSICLLNYFSENMSDLEDGSIIIAENPFFLTSFSTLALSNKVRCVNLYRRTKIFKYILLIYRLFGRSVKFLVESAYELWIARKTGIAAIKKDGKDHAIIIRTWVKDDCFKEDGSFKDNYFGRLIDWLQEKGYAVWIIPEPIRLSQSLWSVFEYYKKQKSYSFMLTENYLRYSDYIKCLAIGLKGIVSSKIISEFLGMDISGLIAGERLKHGLNGLTMIRYYYFCKRLSDSGINPQRVIMTYENKFMDKAFLIGIKHFLPNTITIGYQHCAHYPLLLNFFTCAKEIPYLPLPDIIITSGEGFCKILEEEGFPKERIFPGPALRFEYFYQKKNDIPPPPYRRKAVLIVLPGDLETVQEITLIVRSAMQNSEDLDLLFKVHPSRHAAITELLLSLDLPRNFIIVTEPISSLLRRVDGAISIGATTAEFEIINAGIPLVRLRKELGFTFSPWIKGFEQNTSAEELREKISVFLSLQPKEDVELREIGAKTVRNYFGTINEKNMRMFFD